jgi:hypothetical protein
MHSGFGHFWLDPRRGERASQKCLLRLFWLGVVRARCWRSWCTAGGDSEVMNDWVWLRYIHDVERLFDAAVPIVGVGWQQDRVIILRNAGGQ